MNGSVIRALLATSTLLVVLASRGLPCQRGASVDYGPLPDGAGRVSSHGEPPKILIPSSFPTIQYGALGFRPELVGCMGRFFSVIRFATGLEGSKNLWSFLYVARNKPFVKRCVNTIYNINEAL